MEDLGLNPRWAIYQMYVTSFLVAPASVSNLCIQKHSVMSNFLQPHGL